MRLRNNLLVCGLAAFTFLPVPSFACSCASPPPEVKTARDLAKWHADGTDAILEGTVTRIELESVLIDANVGELIPADSDRGYPALRVTFDISHSYKGAGLREVAVTTGLGGGDCGFNFEVGKQYLVFAFADSSGHLSTGICSGTGLLNDSLSARSYLRGEPLVPEKLTQHLQIPQTKLCGHVTGMGRDLGDSGLLLLRAGNGSPLPADGASVAPDGSFCIEGASPGKYFLAFMARDDESPTSYAFFPGTVDSSGASTVEIETGQFRSDLVFNIPSQPSFPLSGTVVTPNNVVLPPECSVFLFNVDRLSFLVSYTVNVGPKGAFAFRRVLPGKYWAFVGIDDPNAAPNWLTRKTLVEVNAAINNLSLQLVHK